MFSKVRIFLFFLLVLQLPVTASAERIFYVAPSGANSNPGTLNSPWQSLLFAVRKARAGDTIIVRGGVYRMHEVFIDRKRGQGGRLGHYLTIKAYPGEKPVLRPGSRRLIINADYVRVEGLHFIMPWRCDAFGRGLQIVNNTFTGPQPKYGAIEIGGWDVLVEGNVIRFSDAGGNTRDHGIYVHRGQGITIRKNRVIGSKGYGIHVFDEHKSAKPAHWAAHPFAIKNIVIEENYIARSQTRTGIIIAKGRGGHFIRLQNITVRNNVLCNNAEFGLYIREGKNIDVYNNTFYANKMASVFIRDPSAAGVNPAQNLKIMNNIFVSQSHVVNKSPGRDILLHNNLYNRAPRLEGIVDDRPVVGRPKFVDVGALDFKLLHDSPCIDAGVNIGLPYHGTAPDIGAFEFKGKISTQHELGNKS